ncbi:hypothetical protein KDW_57670 [Dictyobacter vulcani]|uniref:3'-phosphate/5'-hydroxy nucleic acid ligase n=1 Tax=Dictyobacter vulcani TaxID=2607529 RepID=A0A5J4KUL5_9CHLR|nr:hypothetical protein KDW_57670 [Dictyobacter vulcani]
MGTNIPLERLDGNRWLIPRRYSDTMHVPGMIYADDELIQMILNDNALQQVANVASLPGIVGYSLGMPDIHWGYGFPVGGVAATDAETGVVSPGGIGFDINCGVRLLATDLQYDQVKGEWWNWLIVCLRICLRELGRMVCASSRNRKCTT